MKSEKRQKPTFLYCWPLQKAFCWASIFVIMEWAVVITEHWLIGQLCKWKIFPRGASLWRPILLLCKLQPSLERAQSLPIETIWVTPNQHISTDLTWFTKERAGQWEETARQATLLEQGTDHRAHHPPVSGSFELLGTSGQPHMPGMGWHGVWGLENIPKRRNRHPRSTWVLVQVQGSPFRYPSSPRRLMRS